MAYLIKNRIIFSCSNLIENNNEVLDNPQKCLIFDFQYHFTLVYQKRSWSLKLVFSCFWMISSSPSKGLKYWICWLSADYQLTVLTLLWSKNQTYDGDKRSWSLRLVFGCFWMVSSCPSKGFKYWICWGDGTGIRLASFLEDWGFFEEPPYCIWRLNILSGNKNVYLKDQVM